LVSKRLLFWIFVLIKRLAGLENCYTRASTGVSQYVEALSSIVTELMNGYVKENGAVGVDDLRRWPPSSNAVSFLSEATSTTSVFKLVKVRLEINFLYYNLIFPSIRCCSFLGKRTCL
jgi:hypothetical protein